MYLKHNSGKSVCISPGYFKLPNVPPVDQQIDFIKLSLSYGHQHVLVMDCIFSHWIESPTQFSLIITISLCPNQNSSSLGKLKTYMDNNIH